VEVDNGRADVTVRDTVLNVFRADGTTTIASSDNVSDEPAAPLLSRACYIATVSEDNLADVTAGGSNTAGGFRIRAVETTMFSPWFFSSDVYEAFILMKNTTSTTRHATVTLLQNNGVPFTAPQTGTLVPEGEFNMEVSHPSPVGFNLSLAFGTIMVAHDGPPGAVIGNSTTLSFTSGVSFDTPLVSRQDHR
jgi:hypothetical protein